MAAMCRDAAAIFNQISIGRLFGGKGGGRRVAARFRKTITAITHAVQVGNSSSNGNEFQDKRRQQQPVKADQPAHQHHRHDVNEPGQRTTQPSGPSRNCSPSATTATASARMIRVRVNFGTRESRLEFFRQSSFGYATH